MNAEKRRGSPMKAVKLGDHLCSVYKNPEEQFSIAAEFIDAGLNSNQKCIYIRHDNSKQKIISELMKRDIDVKKAMKSGQFKILNTKSTYLKEGYFDPEKMNLLLKESEESSLEDGYSGLRGTGEMTWALDKPKGSERLIEYEAKLNMGFHESKTVLLCQFDETRFSPNLLIEVIHTHPIVILYGRFCKNEYYFSPGIYLDGKRNHLPAKAYDFIKKDLLEKAYD